MNNAENTSAKSGQFEDEGSQALMAQAKLIMGKVPEPFGPRRLFAAQALGFRFFKLNDAERAQLNDDNYIYDGMFWDAALCGFLCLCPNSTLFKAVRVPDSIIGEIMTWIDTHKMQAGSANFKEVMDHFNLVMECIIRSSAEQIKTSGPGNAPGEEGLLGE